MNWNVDIKELTGRQILWVALGILAFCGSLILLTAYKYTGIVMIVALIVISYAKWYQAGKFFDSVEAEEAERSRQRAIRELASRHMEDRRR